MAMCYVERPAVARLCSQQCAAAVGCSCKWHAPLTLLSFATTFAAPPPLQERTSEKWRHALNKETEEVLAQVLRGDCCCHWLPLASIHFDCV